jgi:hypothetical protein
MPAAPEIPTFIALADLDGAADRAIAACGGGAREAVKALLVANDFLEAELAEFRAKVSKGYERGRLPAGRARKEDPDV